MRIVSTPSAQPAWSRPTGTAAPAGPALAPKALLHARARGGDPLPNFSTSADYRNYVINLVGQTRLAEEDLAKARGEYDAGKGSTREISAVRERLDALKLQLMVLRDSYPIPAQWTRSTLLGGDGFDKEKFWQDQVEAIPGKEVVVTKVATPATRPAPPPAPPAAATPAAIPSGSGGAKWQIALDAAVDAASRGFNTNATRSLALATELVTNSTDALVVANAAASKGYGNSASGAYKRATALATTVSEALAVATASHVKGFNQSTSDALNRASGFAVSSTEALTVASAATSRGFNQSAEIAFRKAVDLCHTPAETRAVSAQAAKSGFNRSASYAMEKGDALLRAN